jgi:hypothetical protein
MTSASIRFMGLLCLLFVGQAVGLAATQERIKFTLSGAPWNMTLPAGDFKLVQEKKKPDGSGAYFYLVNEKQGFSLSFFIEPVKECNDSKSCRDMIWKAGNPAWENPQNVVMSEIGEVSTFEFMVPTFRGQPVQQQNLYAQFVENGFWVDLHLSKILYTPKDRELFVALIKSIRFEPKPKG